MVVAQNNNNGNQYYALANLGGTNAQVISGQTNQSGDGLRVNFDSNTTVQEVAGRISSLVDGTINAIDNLNNNGGTTSVAVTVGGATTHVTRNNMFRFIRLLLLLCQIHDHLIANANLYTRGLWYFYSHYLGKDNITQKQFCGDMVQVSTSLSVPLQGLNVKERKNTWIFGSAVLKIEYRDGMVREVDLSLDDHGWLGGDEPISSDMNTGNIKSVTASSKTCNGIIRVIVVEKHCIFQQLCANGFDKSIKAILICSGGYPSKNTKAWLSFLKAALSVRDGNCGVVHDLNPCGIALGHSFSTNKFPGYNAYITDVRIIGLQTRVMSLFPKVVEYARSDKSKQFSEHDKKMFKYLFKLETGFHKGESDLRFLELVRLYSPSEGFGFKVDLDAVVAEYGIKGFMEALKRVIDNDLLL
ncbi:hypothetical protein THAOC_32245 [Thalassiosira oceanica]|uniref:Topoisomerase 6 subunit A/Spo11 TOPRIM domain-containing protein n=1 Tax=Thalassiosira oceanica TaxID=159749 RepID=K0R9K9_THAOC|nr:hypothetical protein THAOC_32245 [Thalassiosira oceanica]|eukprot:EJK48919.1 hypothetical protein THAOC_32245 [Thalassiosira oceanica]